MATLANIRTKVRRLTRKPSVAQITDAEIDNYVNTFILYDIPESLRLFTLRRTFEFYTEPNQDIYETSNVVGDIFYQFKDRYITVHSPVYIAGRKVLFTQSRDQFYNIYPFTSSIVQIGTGDGINLNFVGNVNAAPILQNQVLFSSVDINNNGLSVYDDGAGTLIGDGFGVINYITGAYLFGFNTAPANGTAVNSQTYPYVASRPESILYFDNKFFVRPIPDQPYQVSMEVYVRPTELLQAGESPELEQWSQWISYGAAKKIFEDQLDMESIAKIMPEFDKQERLVLRRTIVQQTQESVATIYKGPGGTYGSGWGWAGGFNQW